MGLVVGVGILLVQIGKLDLWGPVPMVIDLFATLSLFSALAGALYERRHQLGLETWHSPERTSGKKRTVEQAQNDAVVTEAYAHVRNGAHDNAWAMLQEWLASRGHAPEDYRWVCDRVYAWPDERYGNRLTEDYVERLLSLKRNSEAIDAVTQRLRMDPNFRPKSAASTSSLAQLATRGGGKPSVARESIQVRGVHRCSAQE